MAEEPTGARVRRRASQRAREDATRAAQERSRAGLESLRDWLRLVFERAASLATSPPTPTPSPLPVPRFVADLFPEYSPVPDMLARRPRVDADSEHWADLVDHATLNAWVLAAAEDDGVARVYETRGARRDERLQVLRREAIAFANDLLSQMEVYDAEQVAGSVDLFWQDISATEEHYEIGAAITPVMGPPGMRPIQLGPGVELRLAEGTWASERFVEPGSIPEGTVALAIRVTWQRQYANSFGSFERERLIDRALLGLRLIRPRAWHEAGAQYQIKSTGRPNTLKSTDYGRYGYARLPSPDHMLTSAEVEELGRLGAALRRMPAAALMSRDGDASIRSLALRSFNRALGLVRGGQDGIVDLAVVLEALLSDSTTELTYKVAMRATLLIGHPPGRAWKLFKVLTSFYALRSSIVHANPSGAENRASEVIQLWRGKAALPQRRDVRIRVATGVGAEIIAEILRACLHLEVAGHAPFTDGFPGTLDKLAFDPKARRKLLREARVISA